MNQTLSPNTITFIHYLERQYKIAEESRFKKKYSVRSYPKSKNLATNDSSYPKISSSTPINNNFEIDLDFLYGR